MLSQLGKQKMLAKTASTEDSPNRFSVVNVLSESEGVYFDCRRNKRAEYVFSI